MSPEHWPAGAREAAETIEAQRWDPPQARTVSGSAGVISATVSPIAAQAGLRALALGGSAADAAATVALTQITTQLGSVVSFAGIASALYFEATTGQVHSLDAGFNAYQGETDPKTIPTSDLGPLNLGRTPTAGDPGRKTLVPGFMAGVQALHDRFGKLPFHTLFEPAIWYAERGVTLSPILASYFELRKNIFSQTPEGKAFLQGAGSTQPQAGATFRQPLLAETLSQVAAHGARYMYTGAWGEAFVAAVRAAGGKATLEDLAAYQVDWSQPHAGEVFGHTVYAPGPPNLAVDQLLTGLHMAEALGLDQRGPCWRDPACFRDLSRISASAASGPMFASAAIELLLNKGVDVTFKARRTKAFAEAAASILDQLFTPPPASDPRHSNSIVVVDARGDVAVMTHTINTVIWGDTGLVVGGVPLPDSAGFQQPRLRPGERLANEIACTLTLKAGKPVLATAPIGSSLLPETLKAIVSVIGQNCELAAVVAAPPLLINMDAASYAKPIAERPVSVPAGAYNAAFLEEVGRFGLTVTETPAETARGVRGTLACVAIDPASGRASSPETPGVMVFGGAV